MQRWRYLFIGVLFAGLAGPSMAGSTNVAGGKEFGGDLWFQDMSGSLSGRNGLLSGSATVVQQEETAPGVAVTLHTIGNYALDLSFTSIDLTTQFRSAGGFHFGGVSFGTVTDGTVDYKLPIGELEARYIAYQDDTFRFCTSAVLKVTHADITVANGSQSYQFDHVLPIPMAGVSGQVNFASWLKAYGSYKFLNLGFSSVKTSVNDWEGGVIGDWNPGDLHTFRVTAGYRKLTVELEENPGQANDAQFEIQHVGPFLEISSSF